MLNIILFGPPGAGKGTQSEKLLNHYRLNHISTGDLLRSEIAGNTPLGLEARAFLDRGELVPDAVVIGMIRDYLLNNEQGRGVIFDGFPRTVAQARALDELLKDMGREITVMLALDVPEEELVSRLSKRGTTSGRTDDSSEEIIRNRIRTYEAQTLPVAEHYKESGKYRFVKGTGSIEEIFARLTAEIDGEIEKASSHSARYRRDYPASA